MEWIGLDWIGLDGVAWIGLECIQGTHRREPHLEFGTQRVQGKSKNQLTRQARRTRSHLYGVVLLLHLFLRSRRLVVRVAVLGHILVAVNLTAAESGQQHTHTTR